MRLADLTGSSGFDPVAAAGAKVLVLGSFPSVKSLSRQQYYGNPQNAFWRIMGQLLDADSTQPYAEKVAWLVASDVALWDVLRSSVRRGSLDANIALESAIANEFTAFYDAHRQIKLVCFNGQKAAQLYSRLVLPSLPAELHHLDYKTLPSSSPAYAAMGFGAKLKSWSIIKGALDVP